MHFDADSMLLDALTFPFPELSPGGLTEIEKQRSAALESLRAKVL
jgi:hypothetical protein